VLLVRQLHQWEREEEHLDHIKRIASAQARSAKSPFVSEEFEHYRLIVSAHRVAHLFLAVFIRRLSDMFDQFLHFGLDLTTTMKNRTRGRGDIGAPPGARVHRR